MTHFRCHRSVLILVLGFLMPLAGCATDTVADRPVVVNEALTKEKKPSALKKTVPNRAPIDDSAPPVPAKPPAVGGSGG